MRYRLATVLRFMVLLKFKNGARDRNRTGTPVIHEAADFKSDVSTYFTTRARDAISNDAAVNKGHCETKSPINNALTGPI